MPDRHSKDTRHRQAGVYRFCLAQMACSAGTTGNQVPSQSSAIRCPAESGPGLPGRVDMAHAEAIRGPTRKSRLVAVIAPDGRARNSRLVESETLEYSGSWQPGSTRFQDRNIRQCGFRILCPDEAVW